MSDELGIYDECYEPDEDDAKCPGCGASINEECSPECEYYEL